MSMNITILIKTSTIYFVYAIIIQQCADIGNTKNRSNDNNK